MDPKISMWLNVGVSVLSALMGASAQLTTIFGQGKAQAMVSICGLLVAIVSAANVAMHGTSTAVAGPMKQGESK